MLNLLWALTLHLTICLGGIAWPPCQSPSLATAPHWSWYGRRARWAGTAAQAEENAACRRCNTRACYHLLCLQNALNGHAARAPRRTLRAAFSATTLPPGTRHRPAAHRCSRARRKLYLLAVRGAGVTSSALAGTADLLASLRGQHHLTIRAEEEKEGDRT